MNDEKLRIAIIALEKIAASNNEAWVLRDWAEEALKSIRRDHYLNETSNTVQELTKQR